MCRWPSTRGRIGNWCFTGGDSGANSTMYAESSQTLASLETAATPPNLGIKSINLGTDGTHTTPNSLHLADIPD